jgi:hypothetical protein
MAVGEVFRIRNMADTEFKGMYNGNVYKALAGSETIVPVEAAILWFGNPHARDIDARRLDRTAEFKRLRVKYGAYDNLDDPNGVTPMWESVKPQVEVYTLDGDRVITVVDDPFGEMTATVEVTRSERTEQQGQVEALTAQLADMQAMLNRLVNGETTDPDADPEAAEDAPPGSMVPPPVPGTARPVSNPVPRGQEAATAASLRPPKEAGKPVTEDRPNKVGVN